MRVIPLIGGEAWTPLLFELLYERGKLPGAGARVISGSVKRSSGRYSVVLSLSDHGNEVSRIERSWTRGALDSELGAALDALLTPQKEQFATDSLAKPPIQPIAESAPHYRYRTAAWALTVTGAAGIAGGLALVITNRVFLSSVTGLVEAYNARSVRTQAEFVPIQAQRNALVGMGAGAYVALGIGAAALASGIVLFAIDRDDTRLTIVPSGPGVTFAGAF